MKRNFGGIALACAVGACGGSQQEHPVPAPTEPISIADVAVLEVHSGHTQVDRFASCPPMGQFGQSWTPPKLVKSWSLDANGAELPATSREEITRARYVLNHDFRECRQQALRADPTQEGHVALIARVAPDGHVSRVDEAGACGLSAEAIACMQLKTGAFEFKGHHAGETIISLPATFLASTDARGHVGSDSFAASAYVTIEETRPQLHACEDAAHAAGRSIFAHATMRLTIDKNGKVLSNLVEPYAGDSQLLLCTAKVMEALTFMAPPLGKGEVIARVAYEPHK